MSMRMENDHASKGAGNSSKPNPGKDNERGAITDRTRRIVFHSLGVSMVFMALLFVSAVANAQTHLRITNSASGWNHFKLGDNPSNLWGPKVSPAIGQSFLRLRLNNFSGADWNRLAVAPDGNNGAAVAIGQFVSGSPSGWFTVDIPLSAFPAGSLNNISHFSIPFSQGAPAFDIGVADVSFTGGGSDYNWFGGNKTDNQFQSPWAASLVVDGGGGSSSSSGGSSGSSSGASSSSGSGGSSSSGSSSSSSSSGGSSSGGSGGTCANYLRVSSASAVWGHMKLGANSSNIWGPKISPAAGQTTLRLRLQAFGGVDWSKINIAPSGNGAEGIRLGTYVPANASGWVNVEIPLSRFPSGAFTDISNISVPFAEGTAFDLGICEVAFTGGGSDFVWFGGSQTDNAFEAGTLTVSAVNGGGSSSGGSSSGGSSSGGSSSGGSSGGGTGALTFGEFAGTNVLPNTPTEPLEFLGPLRIYVPSDFFGTNAGAGGGRNLAFEPGDGWIGSNDAMFRRLRDNGQHELMATLESNFAFTYGERYTVPVDPGLNSNLPSSWAYYYDICYQFAARYGRANPGDISVRGSNQPLTGLDLVRHLQPRNEVYKSWTGVFRDYVRPDGTVEQRKTTDWAPEEEAAMMVQCYNGAKAADPDIIVAWPAVPGFSRAQMERTKAWLNIINGGELPADEYVINQYWNTKQSNIETYDYTNGLDFQARIISHPESLGGLKNYWDVQIPWIKSRFPNIDIVIGEFGWDSGTQSWQLAPGTALTSSEAQQGQWLVRSYLALFSTGITRAYQFMINGDTDTLFGASGLTTDNYGAKLAWYYVAGTFDVLRDASFVRELNTGNVNVMAHEYVDGDGNRFFALWSPTANDTVVNDFRLQVGVRNSAVTLRELTNGERGGWNPQTYDSALPVAGDGTVGIRVTETPVFVQVRP